MCMTKSFNWSLGADTQQQDAASRRLLRAGQLERWASTGRLDSIRAIACRHP